MAKYEIEIKGDALDELLDIVSDLQREQPNGTVKTPKDYLQQLCDRFLTNRVKQHYVAIARKRDVEQLKVQLGPLTTIKKELRNGNQLPDSP